MAQPLRDELEAILRGWNAYEVARGATPVIDFDLRPDLTEALPVESRLEAYHRCLDVLQRATDPAASHVHDRARADATYLAALLGARIPLDDYLRRTQGCDATGWPPDYIASRRARLEQALDGLGIGWARRPWMSFESCRAPSRRRRPPPRSATLRRNSTQRSGLPPAPPLPTA